ncbi:hypothetical protein POPTR_012G129300v4 [Populus trichocarpa]|uniref:Uncharacterized protein n=1 Tax=Populus trichocarpa TaxID=3694 RepID=A0ACC0S748_POPTR|nr:hypothetical protein POPTR_012G129300v4 [Populus trichocarpa]
MDVAASEFYNNDDNTYDLNFKEENNDGSQKISGDSLKNVYKSCATDYPIVTIEDPFDQDDWEHYAKMTSEIGEQVQFVGDDLLVTNPKVNQIGSVTESIEAVKMSKRAGWGVMASHRSVETEDTIIADLSVGLATGQIQTGAPCRSERLAQYNHVDGNVFQHTQLKMRNLTKYDFSYHTQLKMRISQSILPKFKATQYAGQGERKNYPVVSS